MANNHTFEALLQETLSNAPNGIDTRPGSIFYDAVAGPLLLIAQLFEDLDRIADLTFLDTASGEYLDKKSGEHGIQRHAPINARYGFGYVGTAPQPGDRFFVDGTYFRVVVDGDSLCLEAESSGSGCNGIAEGTRATPVSNIPGLEAATFGAIIVYGEPEESDDSLRSRVRQKVSEPAENGNMRHYRSWCEHVPGVGMARIFPLWNGPNTVRAVLISPDCTGCAPTVVEAVQEYVDPATRGYTALVDGVTHVVGDGLGEGASNIGAHFTASSATEIPISVCASIETERGILDAITDVLKESVRAYLRTIVTSSDSDGSWTSVVRVSAIGAAIASIDGVVDYHDLAINGSSANIIIPADSVPVVGEVVLSVLR